MGCSLIHLRKHKQALAEKGVKSEEGQKCSIRVPDSQARNFACCDGGHLVKGTARELWDNSLGGIQVKSVDNVIGPEAALVVHMPACV